MNEKQLLKNKKMNKIFAVSGGPDSMYLLDLYRQKVDPETIIVAHVNYNFRNDSIIDQNLVEHYCDKYDLKLEVKTVKQELYQNLALNFEEFARNLRYDFFLELAKKYNSEVIFIAHNQNDVVETYLLQKQRQNLVTYYGLPTTTLRKNIWIYRPLLNLKKSYILEQNDLKNIPYHIDQTNFDQQYARNKIRAQLKDDQIDHYIAEIKKLNEKLTIINKQIEKYLLTNLDLDNKTLRINKNFFKFDLELKKRMLYTYFVRIGQEELLIKRKRQTLTELVKLIDNQNKPVLQLNLKDQVIVKDFDKIYIVNANFFLIESYTLNNFDDLKNLNQPKLQAELKKLITNDLEKWPYQLTNDYDNYKNWSYVKTKKVNRYFINQKIKLKNRVKVLALINKDNQLINVKSFSKLWDN